MPWVRFDDQYPINRKVARLSDAAYRLHDSAIFWCARNLTDGAVPEEDLEDVCARVRTPGRFAAEIVGRGLWHEIGYQCDSEECPAHPDNTPADVRSGLVKGWLIHDYLEFQPSKEQVIKDRKGNAARQKKWREQQKQHKEERNAVSNGVSNGGRNAAPARPDPSTTKNTPPPSAGPPKGAKTDRGVRLPDDFTVTDDMAAWAREKAPLCGIADHEAFCDYWRGVPGTKGRKRDWPATWRNWMRREQERRTRQATGTPPATGTARSTTDERVAQAQALKAELGLNSSTPPPFNLIRGELA